MVIRSIWRRAEIGHIGAYGKKESHIALEAALEAKKHLERNGEKTIITRKMMSI